MRERNGVLSDALLMYKAAELVQELNISVAPSDPSTSQPLPCAATPLPPVSLLPCLLPLACLCLHQPHLQYMFEMFTHVHICFSNLTLSANIHTRVQVVTCLVQVGTYWSLCVGVSNNEINNCREKGRWQTYIHCKSAHSRFHRHIFIHLHIDYYSLSPIIVSLLNNAIAVLRLFHNLQL